MTQHIDEARKIVVHLGGFPETRYGEPTSDVQFVAAALAAAAERGRIEEWERIRLDLIVGLRNWMHDRYGKWITFRSAMRFADSITKEPTP